VEVSIPSPAIPRGNMMPAATASHRATERPFRHFTAPQLPSRRMAVTDGVGTTNRSFLLKVVNSRRPILTTIMDLPPPPKDTITQARRILPLMHRLDLLPNTPQGRIVGATEADRSGAANFQLAGGSEAVSRAHSGIPRAAMAEVSLGRPTALIPPMPPPTSPRAPMQKLRRRRTTSRWQTVTTPSGPPKTCRSRIPARRSTRKKTRCHPPAGRPRLGRNPRHLISLVSV
jgi:hypothetical protein